MPKHRIEKLGEQLIIRDNHEGKPDNTLSKIMHGLARECAAEEPSFVGIAPVGSQTKGYHNPFSDYDLVIMYDRHPSEDFSAYSKFVPISDEVAFKSKFPEVEILTENICPDRFESLISKRKFESERTDLALILSALFSPSTGGKVREYQVKIAKIVMRTINPSEFPKFIIDVSSVIADFELQNNSRDKIVERAKLKDNEFQALVKRRTEFWFQHLMKYIPARAAEALPRK